MDDNGITITFEIVGPNSDMNEKEPRKCEEKTMYFLRI